MPRPLYHSALIVAISQSGVLSSTVIRRWFLRLKPMVVQAASSMLPGMSGRWWFAFEILFPKASSAYMSLSLIRSLYGYPYYTYRRLPESHRNLYTTHPTVP